MARLRNITSHELETRVDGRRYTTEPDAILEIDDDVYLAHEWPAAHWDSIDVPERTTSSSGSITDGSVEDVLARVGDDPQLVADALAAEQAKHKPRSTLVAALTDIAGVTDGGSDTEQEN